MVMGSEVDVISFAPVPHVPALRNQTFPHVQA